MQFSMANHTHYTIKTLAIFAIIKLIIQLLALSLQPLSAYNWTKNVWYLSSGQHLQLIYVQLSIFHFCVRLCARHNF